MKERDQNQEATRYVLPSDAANESPSSFTNIADLSQAVERAKMFARIGLPEQTRTILEAETGLDPVECSELLAEAYETAAQIHRNLAQDWRSVRPSDPLSKHIGGYAEQEDCEADRALDIAQTERLFAAEYRRIAERKQQRFAQPTDSNPDSVGCPDFVE